MVSDVKLPTALCCATEADVLVAQKEPQPEGSTPLRENLKSHW